jgi:quercetin dioxygenase-like cupin family protein
MSQDRKGPADFEGVVRASDLVAFQQGSVVSRAVVQKPAGTVTVFAFGAGEGLSEHTAPFDALVLGLDGEADISIGATPHRVKAGELLKLPAGRPHAVAAVSPFKMLLVMIRA